MTLLAKEHIPVSPFSFYELLYRWTRPNPNSNQWNPQLNQLKTVRHWMPPHSVDCNQVYLLGEGYSGRYVGYRDVNVSVVYTQSFNILFCYNIDLMGKATWLLYHRIGIDIYILSSYFLFISFREILEFKVACLCNRLVYYSSCHYCITPLLLPLSIFRQC